MADKRVSVLLYGADRQLWRGSNATLVVRELQDADCRALTRKKLDHPSIDIILQNLPFDSGQIYGLTVDAKGHRTAAQLITRTSFLRQDGDRTIERPDTIFRLMIVPNKPQSSDLDGGFDRLTKLGSLLAALYTEAGYSVLTVAQQMAFLNIESKLRETYIGHDSVLSFVRGIRAVDPDRLFLLVESHLKAAIERSADFASAGGHGIPDDHPDLPACPDSWKHIRYEFGNIQLSFSADTEQYGNPARLCHALDTDIDLARGLGHAAEWLDNNVINPGKKTNQTLVYALLFAQGVLPLYTLDQAS